MSGSSTISSSEPRLANIRIQTSAYGIVVPLIYGRARVGGNLSWYGNFKAIAHTTTTEAGGKGGGSVKQSNTTYTYEAAVIMTLCHGPINAIPSAWKGKERLSGASVAGKVRTLTHTVSVPGGGVVTVPEAAVFKAPVQVSSNAAPVYAESTTTGYALLTEGTDFTRAGGVYTFGGAWVGIVVDIQYQVQDSSTAQSALGQLGLALTTGTPAQPAWSWLATFNPAESLTYSGFAYVYGQSYSLEDSAQLPNHNFEVSTPWERADLGTVDAHPADIIEDLLRDPVRGVGWSADGIASLQPYRDYCTAHGLFMSPVLDTQRTAIDWIKAVLALTNADVVYSGNKIKIVPLGDENKTGNGVTFTANTTPVFDLTVDDFVTSGGSPRIRIQRNGSDDVRGSDGNDIARNVITLEIENRANGYAPEPVSAEDLASMEQFGRRPADTQKASAIKSVTVGRMVAQLMLQREQGRRAQYEFALWANRSLLEPLDLVTLTDADTGLDRWPVRILSIDERDAHSFDVVAEDAPIGMASAPAYGSQAGSGFQHDYSVPPGNVEPPVIFEAPVELTTSTGLEVMVAVRGVNANWGGCRVWISLDGVTFKQAARLDGGSRYGALTAAISGGNLPVSVLGGQLLSGTTADAAALTTLCYVGGSSKEFLAYEVATLTGPNAYTLSGLVRAAYGTATAPHAAADPFVRVDEAIARSGPLDISFIGKTVQFKFTSFNVYSGAEQSLADVSAYAYVITGSMAALKPGFVGKAVKLRSSGLVFQYPKAGGVNPAGITLTAERKGTLVGAATFSVQAGTVTLVGSGDVRTIDPATLSTETATVRVAITDAVATYIDEVTITKVREGADGAPGVPGSAGTNTATITIYQRGSSAPALPSTTATYTFSTAVTTGLNNGWVTSIPTGSNPLYAAAATAASTSATDTIAPGEWSSAVVLAQNGNDGSNGANVAPVFIYKRATSAPALPTTTATFTFASGALSGQDNGWVTSVPSGTDPVYVSTATAFSTGATDSIAPGEWAGVQILAQNGVDGAAGAPGAAAVSASLNAYAFALPADSTGLVSSYTGCTTTMKVFLGTVDDSANWTFSKADGSGVTSSIAGAVVTVTSLSTGQDTGGVTLTATRSGYATQNLVFNISKNKANANSNYPVVLFIDEATSAVQPTDAHVRVRFDNDGGISTSFTLSGSYITQVVRWYLPTGGTPGATHSVRFRLISGTGGSTAGNTDNTWHAISGAPFKRVTCTTNGIDSATRTWAIDFALTASTGTVLSTGTLNMTADTDN